MQEILQFLDIQEYIVLKNVTTVTDTWDGGIQDLPTTWYVHTFSRRRQHLPTSSEVCNHHHEQSTESRIHHTLIRGCPSWASAAEFRPKPRGGHGARLRRIRGESSWRRNGFCVMGRRRRCRGKRIDDRRVRKGLLQKGRHLLLYCSAVAFEPSTRDTGRRHTDCDLDSLSCEEY